MQPGTICTALVALFAAGPPSPQAAAQAAPSPGLRTGWLAANLGNSLVGPGASTLSVLAVDVQLQRDHAWFGLRAAGMLVDLDAGETVAELALLYGRATGRAGSQAAIGAGVSVLEVCENACRITVGLALTARAAVRPVSFLGLGVQLMGDANSASAVVAWTLFVEVGKLRRSSRARTSR